MAEKSIAGVTEAVNDHSGLHCSAGRHRPRTAHRQAGAGLIVARQTLARPAFKAARMTVDELRIDGLQALIIDLEAFGCVVAHVVLHHVRLLDQLPQHLHGARILQIQGDAALAAVGHVGDVVRMPIGVVKRVDLDDLGTQVREDLGAIRTGDRQPQVEHGHPLQRRTELAPLFGVGAGLPASAAASALTEAVCSPTRAAGRVIALGLAARR